MKKLLFLFSVLLILIPNISNANVDATNAFDFKYECNTEKGQGYLYTVFNLGGHHLYYRTYNINQAGVLEIADSSHTTLSKSSNISIPGCGDAGKCDIVSYGTWEKDGDETDLITLKLNFDLPKSNIKKEGDIITINNELKTEGGKDYKDISFQVTGENLSKEFTTNRKIIVLDLSKDGKISIFHGNDENSFDELYSSTRYESVSYNYKKDLRFDLSKDYKTLILKRTPLKRVNSGYLNSGKPNTYSAINGNNTGGDTRGPSGLDHNYISGYSTGLYKWPYSNSPFSYTTTNVRVYPSVSQPCEQIEYNYKDSSISVEGTLSSLTKPKFGGPVKINGSSQTKVGNDYSGITLMATDKLKVSNLRYEVVGKIGNNSIEVNKVEVSIKTNDNLTRGKQEIEFGKIYKTVGAFPEMEINLSDVTEKKGNYQIVFTLFNKDQQVGSYEFPLTIIPNNEFVLKDTSVLKTSDSIYANGKDYVRVCQNFTDSYGNKILRLNDLLSDSFVNKKSNSVTSTDDNIDIKNIVLKSDSKFCFDVYKLIPGDIGKIDIYVPLHKENNTLDLNGKFKQFTLDFGDRNGKSSNDSKDTDIPVKDLTSTDLEFLSPFSYKIEIKNLNGKSWDGVPDIAKTQNYRINLNNIGKINLATNGTLDISKTSIVTLTKGQAWDYFSTKSSDNTFSITDSVMSKAVFLFDGRIDLDSKNLDEKSALNAPKLGTDNLTISYNINGKKVSYPLSKLELEGCKKSTLGVKVEGNIQSFDGIGKFTGQETNFSDLSVSVIRNSIRKNAYSLITGMSNGQILNGIKYIEGDVSDFSDINNYETLIVKNGNVILKSDLNISGKKLGIIVLKDNYNINSDYGKKGKKGAGNVYVGSDVSKINAVIYADGTIRSADETGTSIDDSNLLNILEINGSLFTRNTIGGSLKAKNNSYALPGGQKTNDFDLASVFDLNQLRKVPICGEDKYSVLVKYDSKIQSNPPKGFTK